MAVACESNGSHSARRRTKPEHRGVLTGAVIIAAALVCLVAILAVITPAQQAALDRPLRIDGLRLDLRPADCDAAAATLRSATVLDPDGPAAYLSLGILELALGHNTSSVSALEDYQRLTRP